MNDSRHIDIYDNSEVQPPSYLNVKDAPDDSDTHTSDAGESTYHKHNHNNLEKDSKVYASDSNACNKSNSSKEEVTNMKDSSKKTSRSACTVHNERFGYNLTRSKSVCDLSAMNNARLLNTDNAFTVQHQKILEQSSVNNTSLASLSTTNSGASSTQTYGVVSNKSVNSVKTEKSSANQQKVSRIVRNRTILGSFPLFYKLSQSLSSLNSGGVSVESVSTCKSTFPGSEKHTSVGKESSFSRKLDVSSLYYPKPQSTRKPVRPGATLGGGVVSMNSSIITEYDAGCFYMEDANVKDR